MRPADVCGCARYPSPSRSAMILRMVAGLSFQAMDFASVRDPTGSPEFTYDRTISLRLARVLSSSCRASVFALIALFIASGNDRVNGAMGSEAEFSREIFLKSPNKCASKLFNRRALAEELSHTGHFTLQGLAIRQTGGSRQNFAIAGNRHRAMLEKTAPHPALRAAGDLAAINHELIAGS